MPIMARVTTSALPPSEIERQRQAGDRHQPDHAGDVDDRLAGDAAWSPPAATSRRNGSLTRRAMRRPV